MSIHSIDNQKFSILSGQFHIILICQNSKMKLQCRRKTRLKGKSESQQMRFDRKMRPHLTSIHFLSSFENALVFKLHLLSSYFCVNKGQFYSFQILYLVLCGEGLRLISVSNKPSA